MQESRSFVSSIVRIIILMGLGLCPYSNLVESAAPSIQVLPGTNAVSQDRTIRWRVGKQTISFTPPKGCTAVPSQMPDLPDSAIGGEIRVPQVICPQTRCAHYGFMDAPSSVYRQPTRNGDGPACRRMQELAKLECPERSAEITAAYCRTWAHNL